MTREEAIAELTIHLEHWKRLKAEHIASKDESERTIKALVFAISALEREEKWLADLHNNEQSVSAERVVEKYQTYDGKEYITVSEKEYLPIVRCKDCKQGWYDDDIEYYVCRHPKGLNEELYGEDFCSYGERKGGAE